MSKTSNLPRVVVQTVAIVAVFFLVITNITHADVTATVTVPNGTTNFPGMVQWSLNEPGELSSFFEIDVNPGMSANNIATSMEFEIDDAFGFEADVSGSVLSIPDKIGNLATAAGDFEIEWEVTLPPGDGGGIDHVFNNILTVTPGQDDAPSFSIIIAGPGGSPTFVAVVFLLTVDYEIETNDGHFVQNTIQMTVPAGESTALINLLIDGVLQNTGYPAELQYTGLNNGFPTFKAPNGFKRVSLLTSARPIGRPADPGVTMGYIMQPAYLLGDINCDGAVNLLDVEPFVHLISSGDYSEKGDFNGDGVVNLLDVEGFIDALSGL